MDEFLKDRIKEFKENNFYWGLLVISALFIGLFIQNCISNKEWYTTLITILLSFTLVFIVFFLSLNKGINNKFSKIFKDEYEQYIYFKIPKSKSNSKSYIKKQQEICLNYLNQENSHIRNYVNIIVSILIAFIGFKVANISFILILVFFILLTYKSEKDNYILKKLEKTYKKLCEEEFKE